MCTLTNKTCLHGVTKVHFTKMKRKTTCDKEEKETKAAKRVKKDEKAKEVKAEKKITASLKHVQAAVDKACKEGTSVAIQEQDLDDAIVTLLPEVSSQAKEEWPYKKNMVLTDRSGEFLTKGHKAIAKAMDALVDRIKVQQGHIVCQVKSQSITWKQASDILREGHSIEWKTSHHVVVQEVKEKKSQVDLGLIPLDWSRRINHELMHTLADDGTVCEECANTEVEYEGSGLGSLAMTMSVPIFVISKV